jgi:hypothetical protein
MDSDQDRGPGSFRNCWGKHIWQESGRLGTFSPALWIQGWTPETCQESKPHNPLLAPTPLPALCSCSNMPGIFSCCLPWLRFS